LIRLTTSGFSVIGLRLNRDLVAVVVAGVMRDLSVDSFLRWEFLYSNGLRISQYPGIPRNVRWLRDSKVE